MAQPRWSTEAHKYAEAFAAAQLRDCRTGADGRWAVRVASVVELVGDAGGGRILDLGCGAGTFALRYAREGLRTVGVDASPQVIATARTLAREEGLRHCQFVVADISHLSIRAESFDLIMAADIFEHLPMEILVSCLDECWRVLIPVSRQRDAWERVLETFDYYSPRYQSKHTFPEVHGWFVEAGLSDIRIFDPPVTAVGRRP